MLFYLSFMLIHPNVEKRKGEVIGESCCGGLDENVTLDVQVGPSRFGFVMVAFW